MKELEYEVRTIPCTSSTRECGSFRCGSAIYFCHTRGAGGLTISISLLIDNCFSFFFKTRIKINVTIQRQIKQTRITMQSMNNNPTFPASERVDDSVVAVRLNCDTCSELAESSYPNQRSPDPTVDVPKSPAAFCFISESGRFPRSVDVLSSVVVD
uniref:Uncharacterized protein n=1 Tax=Diadegma fenestrale ichnovirus TaxID=1428464 RepID=A0A075VXN7_9VIRU|nr:hypothetical protein B1.2 [Diadegma fenestrale ichnovirus]